MKREECAASGAESESGSERRLIGIPLVAIRQHAPAPDTGSDGGASKSARRRPSGATVNARNQTSQ